MDIKRATRSIVLFAAAALVLASCQLAGVTSDVQDEGSAESRSLATSSAATTRIYCTAAINPVSFFFEFDLDSAQKTARVLLPLASDSYIQGDKGMCYKPVEYKLAYFDYDQASQAASMGKLSSIRAFPTSFMEPTTPLRDSSGRS